MLFFSQSCKHDPLEFLVEDTPETPIIDPVPDTSLLSDCDPDTVYFENDIYPLLLTNCAISGCHDAETHEEGINLSSYAGLMASDILDLGDPMDSELYEVITEMDFDDRMPPPPNPKLTAEEIALLIEWQNQGGLNNSCTECDTAEATYTLAIAPIMNTYCTGCHDHSSPAADIDLTAYVGTGAFSGVSDVAADGRLLGALNYETGFVGMPMGGLTLPQCYIDQITAWVDAGYPDN